MGSRQLFTLVLLTYLVFLFISLSNSSSADDAMVVSSSFASTPKVDMSFYYETLCPYCANFMVNHLVKLFETKIISIVNLKLLPWGNAIIKSDNTIVCQHGPDECKINTVEACAINVWPDLNTHFKLIYCIERLAFEEKHDEWASCFQRTGLALKPVQDCYNGGHGIELELQYAKETARLNPPHEYVPWVVVNNKPLREDYGNFLTYICEAYKGPAVPTACKSLKLKINSSEKANPMMIHQVCYAGDAKNLTSSTPAKRIKGQRKLHGRAG